MCIAIFYSQSIRFLIVFSYMIAKNPCLVGEKAYSRSKSKKYPLSCGPFTGKLGHLIPKDQL